MESNFATLFLNLQAYIQTKVPAIKWVDMDHGQLENYKEGYRPPVIFPCVLIEFDEWDWSEGGNGIQTGTGSVIIRLGFTPMTSSATGNRISQKENALEYLDIEHQLNKHLHGYTNSIFDRFLRRSSVTEKRNDDIRVRILRYTTGLIDKSGKPLTTKIPRPEPFVAGSEDDLQYRWF